MIYLNGTNDYLLTVDVDGEIYYVFAKEDICNYEFEGYDYYLITKEEYDKKSVGRNPKHLTSISPSRMESESLILKEEIVKYINKVGKDGKKSIIFMGVKCFICERHDSEKNVVYITPENYDDIDSKKTKMYFHYYEWREERYIAKVKEITCPICDNIVYVPVDKIKLDTFSFKCIKCDTRISVKRLERY